jgi:uncharacterized glyoxalase superfamily protein PhnB
VGSIAKNFTSAAASYCFGALDRHTGKARALIAAAGNSVRSPQLRKAADLTGTRLIPALRYRDLDRAIEWLCTAFGFSKREVVTGADGGTLYAHLTHGTDMILVRSVGESALDQLMMQPDEIGGAETQSCYLVVEDADRHCARAKATGADILLDVADDDHGGRGYSCRDLEGHVWSFGTYNPWPGKPLAQSAAFPFATPRVAVALSAVLACLVVGAAAGWMLPRTSGEEVRLKQEADTARARAEQGEARASQLADEVTRHVTAKTAAERSAREAYELIEQEQGGRRAAETNARELEKRLAEQRRASDAAAQAARAEVAKEQAAKKEAQRVNTLAQQELAREREGKQKAENSARNALDRLAQERQAREAAERAAKEAREKLAEASKEKAASPAKAKNAKGAPTKSSETEIPSLLP